MRFFSSLSVPSFLFPVTPIHSRSSRSRRSTNRRLKQLPSIHTGCRLEQLLKVNAGRRLEQLPKVHAGCWLEQLPKVYTGCRANYTCFSHKGRKRLSKHTLAPVRLLILIILHFHGVVPHSSYDQSCALPDPRRSAGPGCPGSCASASRG